MKQLTFYFHNTTTCTECGNEFEVFEFNPHLFCMPCIETFEAQAELSYETLYSRTSDDYEARQLALPGTPTHRALGKAKAIHVQEVPDG